MSEMESVFALLMSTSGTKEVLDTLYTLEARVKRTLDAGVAPAEYEKLNKVYSAIKVGLEVTPKLAEKMQS